MIQRWLRKILLKFLGLEHVAARLDDLERHFVTRRDQAGAPVETLADIPPEKREELRRARKQAGMSWPQRKAYLEATDGETREARPERLPSLVS
jgi:hypothetical protein